VSYGKTSRNLNHSGSVGLLRSGVKLRCNSPTLFHCEDPIHAGDFDLVHRAAPLGSVAAVLADTGMRPDECYRLRWESVTWTNGRNGTILVTHGKTAAARRVLPLTVRARNILHTRWEVAGSPTEGWVWSAPTRSGHFEKSTLKKQHKKALRVSRVRPFVLYSLRHTFLTRLGESGCDAWTLARIAGHTSVAMSGRYVHPSEDAVLSALERLSGHNFGHSGNGSEKTATVEPLLSASND
jgi:integrase